MLRLLGLTLILTGAAYANTSNINYSAPYTKISKNEAKSLVIVGMDQKTVSQKCGPANIIDINDNGIEVWQYLADPHAARITHSGYYGFEVFFRNKQVTYVGIILGSN
jgi:hypothetical protein